MDAKIEDAKPLEIEDSLYHTCEGDPLFRYGVKLPYIYWPVGSITICQQCGSIQMLALPLWLVSTVSEDTEMLFSVTVYEYDCAVPLLDIVFKALLSQEAPLVTSGQSLVLSIALPCKVVSRPKERRNYVHQPDKGPNKIVKNLPETHNLSLLEMFWIGSVSMIAPELVWTMSAIFLMVAPMLNAAKACFWIISILEIFLHFLKETPWFQKNGRVSSMAVGATLKEFYKRQNYERGSRTPFRTIPLLRHSSLWFCIHCSVGEQIIPPSLCSISGGLSGFREACKKYSKVLGQRWKIQMPTLAGISAYPSKEVLSQILEQDPQGPFGGSPLVAWMTYFPTTSLLQAFLEQDSRDRWLSQKNNRSSSLVCTGW